MPPSPKDLFICVTRWHSVYEYCRMFRADVAVADVAVADVAVADVANHDRWRWFPGMPLGLQTASESLTRHHLRLLWKQWIE